MFRTDCIVFRLRRSGGRGRRGCIKYQRKRREILVYEGDADS